MLPSVRAFLAGIIDYAGLFPPAQLSLDQAIRNYARYRTETESWMLGRFVCPVERLPELALYHENLFQQAEPFTFSVVANGAQTQSESGQTATQTTDLLRSFCALQGVHVSTLELRVSVGPSARVQREMEKLFGLQQGVRQCAPLTSVYFEFSFDAAKKHTPVNIIASVMGQSRDFPKLGLKVRCGGLHASTFPPVEQLGQAIAACRDAGVRLKFTAGLHHPVRHYNADLRTHMHGFLNVFGAGILARNLSESQICEILADEDPSHFVFTEERFCWKDQSATIAEINSARQHAVISFGSCSFDEPRDDLRKLGLL